MASLPEHSALFEHEFKNPRNETERMGRAESEPRCRPLGWSEGGSLKNRTKDTHIMKRLHSMVAGFALAILATPAGAIEFPVAADTAGSTVTKKITKLAGTATTLPVSSRSSAFLSFGVGGSGIDPNSVTDVRLIIYLARVTKGGNLTVSTNATGFQEKFTAATIPTPSVDNFGSVTVPVTTTQNKSYLVIRGLTVPVGLWLNDASSDFGLAISGDANLNVLLASKEGAGLGGVATLEIEQSSGGGSTDISVTSVTSTGSVVSGGAITAAGTLTGGSLAINGTSNFADSVTIKNDKNLTLEGAGSIIVGGGIDAGGNVTANAFASSSVATDNLTAHVNAKLQGTSTFGGQATFNGLSVFLGDMTLGSNKTLGGGGSIDLAGTIATGGDGRFGSTLSVGSGSLASRGQLDVRGSLARAATNTGFSFINPGTPFVGTGTDGGFPTGIFCDSQIVGAGLNAISDARIKDIQGRSDSRADLEKLLQVEVTDYFFKDRLSHGQRPQKKVIAQQVEKFYPQAISLHTDVVPDLFQKASIGDGWVSLATDLKVGERVRLLGAKAREDGVYEVLEVGETGFRTAFQPEGAEVFVYGREVSDFRTVDYDAIAMLNVSATQELAKRLQAKDAEITKLQSANEALSKRLADLEARDTAMQARLTRLEASTVERSGAVITAALKHE